MSSKSTNSKALRHLRKDPVMRSLIKKHGILSWDWESDLFSDLVESIISQQLSEKAAATIFDRFKKLFKKKSFPSPEEILAVPDEKIRECGISFAKISYIKGLCQVIIDGGLDIKKLDKLSDEEVLEELTKIKGIGNWTGEMILMFSLKRMDVFSLGDSGLRSAIARLYKVDRNKTEEIEKIVSRWRPYRTLACRYLWRSLDEKA